MSRIVALQFLFLTFILAGCQGTGSQGPVDPFLGPTRIPAPPTGSVYTPPPESYYYSPPQHAPPRYLPPQSGAPMHSFPQGALPAHQAGQPRHDSGATLPSEGWSATPSFSGAALVSESTTPDLRTQPDPRVPAAATVNREPIIRILEPLPRPGSVPIAVPHNSVPTRVVNIVDLPRATNAAPSGFRLVSAEAPSNPANIVIPAVAEQPIEQFAPAAGHYGFDPSYAWLRGKLEYSQVDRRWKLRYIPVDGNTDQYGGSVIIANEAALAGCERGEFVAVHGRVAGTESEHDFAPVYEVTALERLGR